LHRGAAAALTSRLWKYPTLSEEKIAAFEVDGQRIDGSGLYSRAQIRAMNETRMWAFWKLGRLLKGIERGKPGRNKGGLRPQFKTFIAALDPPLAATSAKERQRAGAMPEKAMERAVAEAHKRDEDLTISGLLRTARRGTY
jgi:hypothetical protein